MKIIKVLSLSVGIFILIGILKFPYNYYIFLRFSTFSVCIIYLYNIYIEYQKGIKTNILLILLIFSALIVFNPIMPFTMQKSSWAVIDGIYGVLFILYGLFYSKITFWASRSN